MYKYNCTPGLAVQITRRIFECLYRARLGIITILIVLTSPFALSDEFHILLSLSDWNTPYSKGRTGAAYYIALEKVNRDTTLLPGHLLTHTLYNCSGYEIRTIEKILTLREKERYTAFFGPVYSVEAEPIGKLSMVWNTAYMCSSCPDDMFLVKKYRYETMIRTFGTFGQLGGYIVAIAEKFGWSKVVILVEQNISAAANLFEQPAVSFRDAALKKNLTINEFRYFNSSTITIQTLREVAQIGRIIIISARGEHVRKFMLHAYDLGLINGEYAFFCIEFFKQKTMFGDFSWNSTDGRNEDAKKAYEALFILSFYKPENDEFKQFSEEVKNRSREEFGYVYGPDEEVSVLAGISHDTVILYAIALNETLAAGGDPYDGKSLVKRLYGRTFKGIQGDVTIDDNGDRDADFMMFDMTDPEAGTFEVVGHYFGHSKTYVEVPGRQIHWPGGATGPPKDEPDCGFFNEYCPEKEPINPAYVVTSVFAGLLLILAIVIIIMYRKYKLQQAVANMLWRISYDDIILHGKMGATQATMKNSTVSLKSNVDTEQVFTKTCIYKGNVYAIKFLSPGKRIALTPRLLLELKQMRDLSHVNATRFIGACFDQPDRSCIITEYCQKGSLQDILENDAIKLDWMFRYSLMLDVCKGLEYLQNSFLKCHGNLKSSNCVVDSRFVLKLTDFGLYDIRSKAPSMVENGGPGMYSDFEEDEHAVYMRALWSSPELLRGEIPPSGTPKSDIYAFGIIMQEIALRCGTFHQNDMTLSPRDIVEKVKEGEDPPFRPVVGDGECPREADVLMTRCWAEEPADRPDISNIKSIVRKLNPATKKGDNILDNLLARMEQYANNLEGLVEERTSQYLEEKKRAEDLLDRLLPRSVSEKLKRGQEVEAENFDAVTIYFSDIVGFTALSASSTPYQVVDLLNDLYTCFDAIIDHFDVYKVETIGDAYMVVSGLPVRNGNMHAFEIARMSLALLDAVKTFKIRHRPGEHMKLRIGIHTGSVCAGVVGLKMPRYCLFGDTVNTASRMESNGLPLKIHVSVPTVNLLNTFNGFEVELRGQVEMKGKGSVTTYWLHDYHGHDRNIKNNMIINNLKG
ncbi:atrial natriuretic peptide receptor 1-like isoform X1 [Ptychodera flava]|uniref:atrial natriuretic peptide receptor 1-like isoform X1 n=1 Tax=Ptychodera flava TaxID=63121 RepID=UPI00396AA43A